MGELRRRCQLHAENFLRLHGSPLLRLPMNELYEHARLYNVECLRCPFSEFSTVEEQLRRFSAAAAATDSPHLGATSSQRQSADECRRTRADMRRMLGTWRQFLSLGLDALRQPCEV